ncbi:MAG TPA: transposase [Terriglobales bacterium]|nr:transposase [Terriglobales bacterium]
MPYGLKRYQESRQPHFITFSCYGRKPYLSGPRVAELFVRCLEQIRKRYGFRVYGYVVMPEHVHLLVSEPDVHLLSTAIQALKIAVSRRASSAGWRQPQPFWQKRYYDHNVRNAVSFENKLRYLHRNPVTRGLCKDPFDWPWSSFRHYWRAERGVVEIESEWTAVRRSGRDPHLPKAGRCGAPSSWEWFGWEN